MRPSGREMRAFLNIPTTYVLQVRYNSTFHLLVGLASGLSPSDFILKLFLLISPMHATSCVATQMWSMDPGRVHTRLLLHPLYVMHNIVTEKAEYALTLIISFININTQ
jgi:hypothetical protein